VGQVLGIDRGEELGSAIRLYFALLFLLTLTVGCCYNLYGSF
jgi:hypothetical protein